MRALRSRAWLVVTSLALMSWQLLSLLAVIGSRRFDPDELEHAHVAYYITLGQVPYRDFFEHHTPLFHYLLAGFLGFFDPDRSADRGMHALFAARHITWGLSIAIVVATFLLARRLRGTTTAWVSACLASSSVVLALRAVEIRPDGLSTLLWLASLYAVHVGLSAVRPDDGRTRGAFCFAGGAIGLAVLTSQKLLLAGPALAVLLGWYLASDRFGGERRSRAMNAAILGGAVLVPWLMAAGYFAAHGAAAEFIQYALFANLRWKSETTARTILHFVARYEPWAFALVLVGSLFVLKEGHDNHRRVSCVLLLVAAFGLFAGLFVVPVPYAQYCLTFTPLFAILAATAIVEGIDSLSAGGWRRPSALAVVAAALFVVAGAFGLSLARPVIVYPFVYPAVVVGTAFGIALLSWRHLPVLAMCLALLALALFPAQWTSWMAALRDGGQIAELRYVMTETGRDDVVLDGWSGLGVFRRHASYYWMLHPGVRAMLSPADVDRMVSDVTSGRVAPAAIVLDENMRQLSPALVSFVEDRYRASGVGNIYVKR